MVTFSQTRMSMACRTAETNAMVTDSGSLAGITLIAGQVAAFCVAQHIYAQEHPTAQEATVSIQQRDVPMITQEKQITDEPCGHILTNIGVWSPDSQWIVYDIRSDPEGAVFDGTRIKRVNVMSGETQTLYESANGAKCGVATYSPAADQVVFILGPENPTPDWQYAANHRRGVIVEVAQPGKIINLDARDITPPFTPGALRGGSHVHVFSGDGQWVSFTYQDHVLAQLNDQEPGHDRDLRNVGVSVRGRPVKVSGDHPRNHHGMYFSVLVTRTTAHPAPGSDQISKAFEDAWVGTHGYRRSDGTWQKRAIAFQGHVQTDEGRTISEAFVVDLPEDITIADAGPLEGTEIRRPQPPRHARQRRLTFTSTRKYPGLQGPRHWLRSAPDGSRIAMLMRDAAGVVQIWTVSPNGGQPVQVTRNHWDVASARSWSPDGKRIAYVADNSIFAAEVETGLSMRFTPRSSDAHAPRPESCVFSPDGTMIAYVRTVAANHDERYNQIFVCVLQSRVLSINSPPR